MGVDVSDYEYSAGLVPDAQPAPAEPPARELTSRQRNVIVITRAVANDMDTNGTRDEQHTAAALRQLADAIERAYVSEMVALVRGWRWEREAGNGEPQQR